MTSFDVRQSLVEALKLDLVGPENGSDLEDEVLNQAPSRWYLTGFLVPLQASESQRSDETADDEIDGAADEAGGTDDAREPEKPAARRAMLPSSMGLSLLIAPETKQLKVLVRWGDYSQESVADATKATEDEPAIQPPGVIPPTRQRPCDLEAHTARGGRPRQRFRQQRQNRSLSLFRTVATHGSLWNCRCSSGRSRLSELPKGWCPRARARFRFSSSIIAVPRR